ncbi:COG4315 family predicted lipoprotein [Achromobacter animicus]
MRKHTAAALALACSALFSAGAHAQAVKTQNGILVDSAGMTLYTFDKDTAGKSACVDQCAKAWPPAMATGDAKPMGDLTVITRPDGSKQWAYKNKPLYLFAKDTKPGDKTGDNFKEIWHVVKP